MSLHVVNDKCCMQHGKILIVVEGDNVEEVTSVMSKKLAMEKAAELGFYRAGISNTSGAYPVDEEGKTYEDQNEQSLLGKIAAYRNDLYLLSANF